MTELLELLAYQRWATGRCLEAVAKLSNEDFCRELGSSFPSVRDTLVHTMGADRAWLGRLEGQSPARLDPQDFPDLQVLREAWLTQLERWPVVVEQFNDPTQLIEYRSYDGQAFSNTLGEIVHHVVNHGTYHRGQITTMLRQLGAAATSLDMIYFFRERRNQT